MGAAWDLLVPSDRRAMDPKDPRSRTDPTARTAGGQADRTPPPVADVSMPGGAVSGHPPAAAGPSSLPPPAAPADRYVGKTIDGRYRVEMVLGEGGMGVVYLARHKVIDKRVAIKVLRADMAREKEMTDRFLQEAKAASSIGNPHIIDISDFGELPDGSTYFVMEWLDGKPLTRVLDETRPVPLARLVHIAGQIADALAAAHQRGIVHRDLKPDNIFIVKRGQEPDFVKILDFGIAKVSTSATARLTRAGTVFGTPHYMSPEQAAGTAVDSRTDVYALGVILYEMASGRVPFDADNFMGILTQHMYKAPVPIRALVPPPDVPAGLEAIILKALSKKPEQRYQTMEEVALDLEKMLSGATPDAVSDMMSRSGGFNVPADFFKQRGMPAAVPATPFTTRTRSSWWLVLGGAVSACVVGAAYFVWMSSSTASFRVPPAPAAPVVARVQGIAPTAVSLTASAQPAPLPAPPKHVLIATEPIDAHVFRNGVDLGAAPLTIDVAPGQVAEIEAHHEGYKSQARVLDGQQPKVSLKLDKIAGARPRPAPAARPAAEPEPARPSPASQPPAMGGSEIVNPWGGR
jgi:eukaryotic-like serine/threonine-protein kinase